MSSTVRTNMKGFGPSLARELTKLAKHNKEVVAKHMENIPGDAELAAEGYYSRTGLRVRNGFLKNATTGFLEKNGGSARAGLRNRMVYAAAVGEFGHEPYPIRAKRGKNLRFRVGRMWISKAEVMHPGHPARHFMSFPLRQVGSDALAAIREEVGFG